MGFRLLGKYEQVESPTLLLPFRYAVATGQVEGVIAEDDTVRPFLYFVQDGDRTVIILNAADQQKRIPADELHDMVDDVRAKRKHRGDDQLREDYRQAMVELYWDRIQWGVDRRNGRVSVGAATFKNK